MRAAILGALALIGCAKEPVTEATFTVDLTTIESEEELAEFMEAFEDASDRISSASGIQVYLQLEEMEGVRAYPIRLVDDLICGDISAFGCNHKKDGKRTSISIDRSKMGHYILDEVIIHELFHWLGHGAHRDNGGVMDPLAFSHETKIRKPELEKLCSESVCSNFRPEAQ